MNETIYIKVAQCIKVEHPKVTLDDILTIYTTNLPLKASISSLFLHHFDEEKNGQLIVSILKIIAIIHEKYPDLTIENLGEKDFIVLYEKKYKYETMRENLFTILICLIAFFGSGYAIMAYHTDIGAKELFQNLSMLFLGDGALGVRYIILSYIIGLIIGMLIFFNRISGKKFNLDPTPLEIQMRLYEKDLQTTIIKDASRRGETFDAK